MFLSDDSWEMRVAREDAARIQALMDPPEMRMVREVLNSAEMRAMREEQLRANDILNSAEMRLAREEMDRARLMKAEWLDSAEARIAQEESWRERFTFREAVHLLAPDPAIAESERRNGVLKRRVLVLEQKLEKSSLEIGALSAMLDRERSTANRTNPAASAWILD